MDKQFLTVLQLGSVLAVLIAGSFMLRSILRDFIESYRLGRAMRNEKLDAGAAGSVPRISDAEQLLFASGQVRLADVDQGWTADAAHLPYRYFVRYDAEFNGGRASGWTVLAKSTPISCAYDVVEIQELLAQDLANANGWRGIRLAVVQWQRFEEELPNSSAPRPKSGVKVIQFPKRPGQ